MANEHKKEKTRGFADFGIPVGSILVFKKDPAITVKTLNEKNKVEYQGKPYSISTLAKQLVGSPVSGYLYFKYGSTVIKSLGKIESSAPAEGTTESPITEAKSVNAEVEEEAHEVSSSKFENEE